MVVFDKPHALTDVPMHYCPGCPHGTIHRIIAEVIEEMGIQDKAIGIAPVGCSVLAYNYFNVFPNDLFDCDQNRLFRKTDIETIYNSFCWENIQIRKE